MAKVPYLQGLIAQDGLQFWHSLDQPGRAPGGTADIVGDETGDVNLTADAPEPVWQTLRTGENLISFNGSSSPLKSTAGKDLTIKHLFVIASASAGTFPNYAGLFSEASAAANGILVGQPDASRFVDFAFPGLEYRKSGAEFLQGNMQSPMSGSVELIEWLYPSGYAADSVQIGKDRLLSGRLWNGKFYGALAYDRVLSDLEVERIRLYAQLKTRNWFALGETLAFPAPEIVTGYSRYSRFYQVPLDFDSITDSHTYEDETKSFNQTNALPPRRWEVEFYNLSWEKAQILDAFWENVRQIHPFNFYDYRRGEFYTEVRVESYERTHEGHKSFENSCRFKLVKYGNSPSLPYEVIDTEPPTVEITAPEAGDVLSGAYTVEVTASDNIAIKRAEYYLSRLVDGELESHFLGYASTGDFSFAFDSTDYEDDEWTIAAYAVDRANNYSDPDFVVIEIDNTPPVDTEAPTAPEDFAIDSVSASSFTASWTAATDDTGVTGYRIRYAKDVDFTVGVGTKTVGNVLTATVTGLESATEYFAQVQARDAAGHWSVFSNVDSATTATPISGFAALTDNGVVLTDTVVLNGDI